VKQLPEVLEVEGQVDQPLTAVLDQGLRASPLSILSLFKTKPKTENIVVKIIEAREAALSRLCRNPLYPDNHHPSKSKQQGPSLHSRETL